MQAYRLTGWQQPPELQEVPVPDPGPGEVLVRVGGAGLCHSDLHVMDWPAGTLPYDLPFTLGHEVAGWVEAVGAGVPTEAPGALEVGQPVAVYGPWGCGRCHRCRQGVENLCENAGQLRAAGGGLGRDGGLAPYMLVPSARFLVPLGDLDPVEAAPLTDAGLTSYHAIKRSLSLLLPGSTAVVIGVGGLGHMAVQLLKALSPAQVVAVDVSQEKLALAREVGADAAVPAGEEAAGSVLEVSGRRGAELVLDMVGSDQTLALAAQVVRPAGHLTLVGLAGGSLPFGFFRVPLEASLAAPYWGTVTELMEVLELARAGRIRAHVERFRLVEVEEAYRRLRSGAVRGRAVVVP
ncbi:MAG TPA: NAD(P)-dependent alcohol dehydrogenase [Actinomycetota bacterium]|nr:NAD(P)-dependent alcohol dehydrogenase [Actinomycetota bacterium]